MNNVLFQEKFLQNKYSKIYLKIIEKAILSNRSRTKNEYFENHHIIPKSIGGLDLKENLVLLTFREHYICHWLLIKFTNGDINKHKMILAFWLMNNRNKKNNNSYTYKKTKELLIKNLIGKKYSDEFKKKLSDAHKGKSPWNKGLKNQYKIKRLPLSEELKNTLRENYKNKSQKEKDSIAKKISKANRGRKVWNKGLKGVTVAWNKGKKISKESIIKRSKTRKKKEKEIQIKIAVTKKIKRIFKISKYFDNPPRCKSCNKILYYVNTPRERKFCNKSCKYKNTTI